MKGEGSASAASSAFHASGLTSDGDDRTRMT
jgi:hypothetical protein